VLIGPEKEDLKGPIRIPFSWMNLENCQWLPRSDCYEYCKIKKLNGWVVQQPCLWTRELSQPLEFKSLLNIPSTRHKDHSIELLDSVIKNHIIQSLDHTGGKISGSNGAAVLLSIHPNTLRARMDKLNIAYKHANIKTSGQKSR